MVSEEPAGDYSDLFASGLRAQFRALRGSTEDLRQGGLRELYRILGHCESQAAVDPQKGRLAVDVRRAIMDIETKWAAAGRVSGGPRRAFIESATRLCRVVEVLGVRIFVTVLLVLGLWFAFGVMIKTIHGGETGSTPSRSCNPTTSAEIPGSPPRGRG